MYFVRPYAFVIPFPTLVSSVIGILSAAPYTVAELENTME